MVNWSVAFAKHLAAKGLSQQEALFSMRAAGIKSTQSSISYWIRGAAYPRIGTRRLIEKWSDGKVRSGLAPASASAAKAGGAEAKRTGTDG